MRRGRRRRRGISRRSLFRSGQGQDSASIWGPEPCGCAVPGEDLGAAEGLLDEVVGARPEAHEHVVLVGVGRHLPRRATGRSASGTLLS